MLARIGCFFLLISAVLIILFIGSDSAGSTRYDYLFIGILVAAVGYSLWRKGRQKTKAERFRLLRRKAEPDEEQLPPL